MQGLAKAEIARKVDEALAIVRLGDQGEKLPGQLSGGQQQRVAIARAIVIEPPLVLMDEPLSNLDAKLRLEMRAEIRRIHELIGSATIYVTHDQEEALSLADRIVVHAGGRGAPGRHAGGPLHPARACRRRRVHGLSQPDPLARGEVRRPAQRRSSAASASPATPIDAAGEGDVVAAIRPEDLKVTAGWPDRGDRRIGAVSRPRFLLLRPHRPTAPSFISAPTTRCRRARPCASRPIRAACWSIRGRRHERAAPAPRANAAAARAACAPRSRRRDAAGSAGGAVRHRAVRLSVCSTASCCRSSRRRAIGSPTTAKFFSDPFLYDTIEATFRLAIPATLINVLISMPVALRVRRMQQPAHADDDPGRSRSRSAPC